MIYAILNRVGNGLFARLIAFLMLPLLPLLAVIAMLTGVVRDLYDIIRYDWSGQLVILVTDALPAAFRDLWRIVRTGKVSRV